MFSGIVNHLILTLKFTLAITQTRLQSFLEVSTAQDAQREVSTAQDAQREVSTAQDAQRDVSTVQDAQRDKAQIFVAASPPSGWCRVSAAPKQR